MEYRTSKELERVAELYVEPPQVVELTPTERLERWAKLLEGHPRRHLSTLNGTEYFAASVRDELRCDDSPISVAFADPMLRAAGMKDDTYGEAKRFFSLSDRQLHAVLCYCHLGAMTTADSTARRVRALIGGGAPQSFWGRAWRVVAG